MQKGPPATAGLFSCQVDDTAHRSGLNALILQVRPGADALYESSLEPWSEYLTGTQGQHPGYDPLAVWLAEARMRGAREVRVARLEDAGAGPHRRGRISHHR